MANASLRYTLDFEKLHVTIHSVSANRPWVWLQRGWDDFKANFGTSIYYGLFFAVLGFLILRYVSDEPYLFTAAISGFMLIGPLAAAGLYEISRRNEYGQRSEWMDSLKGLLRNRSSLLLFGAMLMFTVIGWERLSAILFALFYTSQPVSIEHYYRDVFLSGRHLDFVAAYVGIGAVLAAVIYVLSVIAVPMMVDREVDIVTAMIASVKTVSHNIGAMLVWAVVLVALMAIGFATWMVGMVFILPIVGHASWHAYRDLVE